MAIRDLKGKNVIVTGAASGIGAATACAFGREGCQVILADLDPQGLAETAQLVSVAGGRSHSIVLDVTDAEAFRAAAQEVSEKFGVPHILVNNAGIGAHGSFLNTPMDAVRRVMEVNLFGVYNGCHAFLPLMLASGEACHLLNVASLASIAPVPNMSAYAASKYAVDGLTEVLAMELDGSKVDVTCVHPGVINTPIVAGTSYNLEAGPDQQRRLGEYYQAHGSDPSVVARGMVEAVRNGRAHLFIGAKAPLSEKLKRLSPALARRMSIKMAGKIGYA